MKLNLSFFAVLMGLMVLIAAGCAAPEAPQPPAPAAPAPEAPAAPVETPAAPAPEAPAAPAEMPKEEAKEEAAPAPVETNTVKLVAEDGYTSLENKAIEVKAGSTVTFQYTADKGKTVVTLFNEAGKSVWTSGYLTPGRKEAVTAPLDAGKYTMKITYGKRDEGTITVQ